MAILIWGQSVDTSVSKTSNDDGVSRTNSCLRGFELAVALGKLMLFFLLN